MEKDFLLKRYLADNERYADLLNGIGFAGKQIVTADDLQELVLKIRLLYPLRMQRNWLQTSNFLKKEARLICVRPLQH